MRKNTNSSRHLAQWEESHSEWADRLIEGLPESIREVIHDDFFSRIDAAMELGSKKAISAEIVAADMDLFLLSSECSRRLEGCDLDDLDKLLHGKTSIKSALEKIAVMQ